MNNGNLLNNLLGITNANPAVTKTTAAKARAESTEKFHQALEQVRPETAARKPAARKDTAVAESAIKARQTPQALSRQDTQQDRPQKVARLDAQAKTLTDDRRVATKTEASKHFVDDRNVNETPETAPSEVEPSSELQDQALNAEVLPAEGQDLVALEAPLITIHGSMSARSPDTEDVDGVLELSTSILNPALIPAESANKDEIDLLPSSANTVVVDPSLMASAAKQSITIEIDVEGDSEQLGVAGLQLVSTIQRVSGGVTTGVDAQSATVETAVEALTGQVKNVAMDGADAEVDLALNSSGEFSIDAGDNPDFVLLNSKAALNKLAETTMTAATSDKAAPAVDVKPAIISAAVEAMARLTEAQSPAARAFVVQTGVPVTVGSPQWSQAVGDKVLWLAAQNVSAAEIRLDPPELGPMQVKVSVSQDQASVTFSSPHPAVREALDQQLNRLREMFSEQGLNLVNVDVSDKSFTKREQEEPNKQQNSGVEDDEEVAKIAISQAISPRLVDHYA